MIYTKQFYNNEKLSQIIYEIIHIRPAVISNELILAGKLQLKKLQKKKPEKNSGFDGACTHASQILVERSTNWATKPHVGSEANFSGSFLPRKGVFFTNNIWNNSY